MVFFLSEHLKTSDDAAHGYVQEDVNDFIQEIKSMEEKINLSLLEDFFESSSPADYVKELINTSNSDENKEIVEEVEDRISNLKDNKRNEWNRKKYIKNTDETLKIIKKFLTAIKMLKKFFHLHQMLIKENQNQNLKKVLQKGQY